MCLNARKLARTLTNRYDEALKPSGLKMTQFSVLAHARAFGEIGLSELADAMDLDQTTLSHNVELLRRDGFLAVAKSGLVASSYLPRRAMHSSNMPIRSGKPHSSKSCDRLAGRANGCVFARRLPQPHHRKHCRVAVRFDAIF